LSRIRNSFQYLVKLAQGNRAQLQVVVIGRVWALPGIVGKRDANRGSSFSTATTVGPSRDGSGEGTAKGSPLRVNTSSSRCCASKVDRSTTFREICRIHAASGVVTSQVWLFMPADAGSTVNGPVIGQEWSSRSISIAAYRLPVPSAP
jgi:hypothetical protein